MEKPNTLKIWYSGIIEENRIPQLPGITIEWTNGNSLQFRKGPDIEAFQEAITNAGTETLILLTSPNALQHTRESLRNSHLRFAVVGERCVVQLTEIGISKDQIVCVEPTYSKLIAHIHALELGNTPILYPTTSLKTNSVEELKGMQVTVFKTYITEIGNIHLIPSNYDIIIFGSPSGVDAIQLGKTRFKAPLPKIVAIGPTTEAKLREEYIGLPVYVSDVPNIQKAVEKAVGAIHK